MSNLMVPFNSAVPIASLRKITRTLHDSISRVATGLKVMGGNDAASQSLANTLNARAESFQAVESNTDSGIALLQLAESALLELNNLATRLKEIGVADSLTTNTTADTAALNSRLRVQEGRAEGARRILELIDRKARAGSPINALTPKEASQKPLIETNHQNKKKPHQLYPSLFTHEFERRCRSNTTRPPGY